MDGRTPKQRYCSTPCYKANKSSRGSRSSAPRAEQSSPDEDGLKPTDLVQYMTKSGEVKLIPYAEWLSKKDTGV